MLALTHSPKSNYPEPTFDELIGLAVDFGIVGHAKINGSRLALEVLSEPMDLPLEDAALLLKGLLLGYFYNQARDDLSLARWEP